MSLHQRRYNNAVASARRLADEGDSTGAAEWARAALGFAEAAGVSRAEAKAAVAGLGWSSPAPGSREPGARRAMTKPAVAKAWRRAITSEDAKPAPKSAVAKAWRKALSDRNPFAGRHPADRL